MAKGFTYFDTAYGYSNGKSEMAAKTALVDRYPRESFQLATKLPAWAGPTTAEEAKQMFSPNILIWILFSCTLIMATGKAVRYSPEKTTRQH